MTNDDSAALDAVTISYSDGTTPHVTYGYDVDGQRMSMVDGSGTSTFAYDSLHRLTSATDGWPGGRTVTYGYDLAGDLTSIVYPLGAAALSANSPYVNNGDTVGRAYDPAGRLASVTDWFGNTTTFGYDPDGNLTTTAYPNHTSEANTYDAAGHLTHTTDTGPSGVFMDLPYGRDPVGLLASDNPTGTSPGVTETFGYDKVNRLTGATAGQGAVGVPTKSYAYDASDNLTSMGTGGVANTLTYDAASQLKTRSSLAGGTTTFTSDAKGNRTGSVDQLGNAKTYAYDQENRLVGYSGPVSNLVNAQTSPQAVQVSYPYDGDGLRSDVVWDRTGDLPHVLNDSNNLPGLPPLGGLNSYVTGPGGLPLEVDAADGVLLWFHHDQLGSTRALTDDNGHVVTSYTYDPYGKVTPSGSTSFVNRFLYAGQYTDPASGLIYMRARYYDPATGQFLSRDPITALTREAYGYAGNNPLNGTDPSGLCNEATVACVTGILKGTEELPPGFAKWVAARKGEDGKSGGFVYYVDTPSGNRAELSNGLGSVPLVGDNPPAFRLAYKTHDLGYDLMRCFGSSGTHGEVRRAIDNLLFNDMKADVRDLPWYERPFGAFDARLVYEGVHLNSSVEHYGVPS